MNWINEDNLKEIGFEPLANGMYILVDVFRDEITDVIVAYRGFTDHIPVKGWFFAGYEWAEYFEDIDRLKKLLMIA